MYGSLTSDSTSIARETLRRIGLTARDLRRVSSTNNEVFVADAHVIRINRDRGNAIRLLREAKLCLALPKLAWTPEIIEHGRLHGAAYVIVRRRRGMTLARWWPDMSSSRRRDAIRQLAGCMRAIHSTRTPDRLDPIHDAPQMLGSPRNPTLPLVHGLQRLRAVTGIDAGLIDELEAKVQLLAPSVETFSQSTLIHGDLSLENVLWDGTTVTAVLDFEWSRGAPRELDLDVLGRFLALPDLHVPAAYRGRVGAHDYGDVVGWLAEFYPELFSHAEIRSRLALFALAYEVRAVLRNPPKAAKSALPAGHPYLRLIDAAADGGPAARMVGPVTRSGSGLPRRP